MFTLRGTLLASAVAAVLATPVAAEPDPLATPSADPVILTEPRPAADWSVAIYGGVWTNSTLPSFPYHVVTGKLSFDDAQIVSLIVHRNLVDFGFGVPGTNWRFEGFSLQGEWTLDKHFGLEDAVETTGALTVRSGEIRLGSAATMNLAWSNGLSYAFTAPKYEMGPSGLRGVDSRHLQYFMAFETAFTPTENKHLSAFMRLHHRSGIYGVISPRKTGSNYVGVGLRWSFF